MTSVLGRNWMLAARGVLAMLFGAVALAWSGITLGEFVLLFGAYAAVDGAFAVVYAARAADEAFTAWPVFVEGCVSVAVGVLAWVSPFLPLGLIYLLATWGIITGVLEIAAAGAMGQSPATRSFYFLGGASSVLIGMVIMAIPGAGMPMIVRMLGAYALIFGILLFLASVHRVVPGTGLAGKPVGATFQ